MMAAFEPIKIPLSAPLMTHKGEVRELELKAPKAREFVTHGEPFKLNKDGGFDFDSKACLGFLASMSGIDELTLRDLDAKDFIAARMGLLAAMYGTLGENPTQPQTA